MRIQTAPPILFGAILLFGCQQTRGEPPEYAKLGVPLIDAHVHIFQPTRAFYDLLNRLGVRMLNIAVVDKYDPGYEDAAKQHAWVLDVFHKSHGRVAWCSTFDPEDWETEGFAERTIESLDKTFAQGAVAVKIYKSIGLKLKSRKGEYLMPDDPIFRPILQMIAKRNKTLFAHIAEPISSWLPLSEQKPNHAEYYRAYPDWHMYRFPGSPSKEVILAARDRMLKQNPELRVVGCHLGSMEEDVADIARRLDLYPNFAVDMAARIPDLMSQPRDKVRAFLVRYQDRVLYGTDLSWVGKTPEKQILKQIEDTYARDWKYLATNEMVEADGTKAQGLALPMPVLRKIYYRNAVRWVPEILGSGKS